METNTSKSLEINQKKRKRNDHDDLDETPTLKHEINNTSQNIIFCQDAITIIINFLDIPERVKFTRINKSWFFAIQSLQNMWKNLCCELFQLNSVLESSFIRNAIKYHKDWMKVFSLQFSKLPKKVSFGTKSLLYDKELIIRKLDESYVGNADLLLKWKSPYNDLKILEEYETNVDLQESVSYYKFGFNVREEFIESYLDDESNPIICKRLQNLFKCCLMYEFLTIGNYVPNMLSDRIRIDPPNLYANFKDNSFTIPFPFLMINLLYDETQGRSIHGDLNNIFINSIKDEQVLEYKFGYLSGKKLKEVLQLNVVDFDFRPNMIETTNHNNTKWLSFQLFYEMISKSEWNDFEMKCGISGGASIFQLYYYNAGGGVADIIDLRIRVDENDGSLVKLIRKESRKYW